MIQNNSPSHRVPLPERQSDGKSGKILRAIALALSTISVACGNVLVEDQSGTKGGGSSGEVTTTGDGGQGGNTMTGGGGAECNPESAQIRIIGVDITDQEVNLSVGSFTAFNQFHIEIDGCSPDAPAYLTSLKVNFGGTGDFGFGKFHKGDVVDINDDSLSNGFTVDPVEKSVRYTFITPLDAPSNVSVGKYGTQTEELLIEWDFSLDPNDPTNCGTTYSGDITDATFVTEDGTPIDGSKIVSSSVGTKKMVVCN